MKRLQAYRFELRPNGEQTHAMRRFAGSCRFVFNKALALQQTRYEAGEKKLSYADLCKELTIWKSQPETTWLNDSPSQSLQQCLKDMEQAYKNFFENEVEQPVHPATSMVGIDMGIARFATLSDGSFIEPLNSFKKHEVQLARAQRRMSRKKKFSSNWKRARSRVTKIQSRIAHVRKDFLHKTSTTISKNHAMIVLEDLKVSNMSRSAAGSKAAPGRNVRQKSGLNRSILDQGWSEFRRQLEYKQTWRGGEVLAVPPQYTSQTCPACDHISADNRRTQAKFECVACGFETNADLVGSINILNRGTKMLEGQDTTDASVGCLSTARIACEVNGAVIPSATGTRRKKNRQPKRVDGLVQ